MKHQTSENKRIAKNTVYLYLRTFLTMLITLYTSRVVLAVLGTDDYGTYNVVGGIAASFTFLSSMLSNATQRYLNFAIGRDDADGANRVFNMNMLIYVVYGVCSVVLVEAGGLWFINHKMVIAPERMGAAYVCLHSTVVILFVSLVSSVYESVLIARENMKVYAYMGIYDAATKLGIVYLISALTFDKLVMYALLMAAMHISARLIPTVYTMRHYAETRISYFWDKARFREMSKFIGWNFFGTTVFILNDQGMNMLLNIFFGPVVNAARGLSLQVKNAVSNFSVGFFTAVRPQIVKSYAAGENERFLQLIFGSGKYTLYLLWLLCLPVMMRVDCILTVWLGQVPEWTGQFVIWILIFNILNSSFCDPVWQGMQAIGSLQRYVLVGSTIYLLAFPLTWGAFAMGCSPLLAFQILVGVRIAYYLITIRIFRKHVWFAYADYARVLLWPVVKVVSVSTALSLLVDACLPEGVLPSVLSCLACAAIVGTSVLLVGIGTEERKMLSRIIKKKLCRES